MDSMIRVSWWAIDIIRETGVREPILIAIPGENPDDLLPQAKKLFGDDVVDIDYDGH